MDTILLQPWLTMLYAKSLVEFVGKLWLICMCFFFKIIAAESCATDTEHKYRD